MHRQHRLGRGHRVRSRFCECARQLRPPPPSPPPTPRSATAFLGAVDPDTPTADLLRDGDDYIVTCDVYDGSCGAAPVIARTPTPDGVREVMRNLETASRVCPYECAPGQTAHALTPVAERALYSGQSTGGLYLAGLSAVAASSSASATIVRPSYTLDGITQAMCTEVAIDRRLLGGMLAVWVAHEPAFVSANTPGTCALYNVVRTATQRTLWEAFATHAHRTTSLPHYASAPTPVVLSSVPNAATACGPPAATCFMWHEFNDETYACDPQVRFSGGVASISYYTTYTGAAGNQFLSPVELVYQVQESGRRTRHRVRRRLAPPSRPAGPPPMPTS